MKKQLIYSFLVLFLCFCFVFFYNAKHEKTYTLLDIDSENHLCIDLNSDNICSNDEYFGLKHIVFNKNEQKTFKGANDYLKTLKNKKVTLGKYSLLTQKYAKIYLDNKDIGLYLLSQELAEPYLKDLPVDYIFASKKDFSKVKIKNHFIYPKKEKEIIELPYPNGVFGSIELYLIDPNKYSRPSKRARTNAAQALIKNINNAKYTIDAVIYGIESQDEIIKALINAKKRGVRVRFVLDNDPQKGDMYSDSKILRENFAYRNDDSFYIMHNKFFIFDGQKVATYTMNLSQSGSGGYDSNTGVIINSKAIAQVFSKEFEQMFSGNFHTNKAKNELVNYPLGADTIVSVYFSPASDILSPILDEIKKSRKEILISAFYLTHRDIISELINAKKRGVNVIVTIDALASYNFRERINNLRENSIKVKVENWGGKNHQKNMLIDTCTFISGSANFSKNAVLNNDENTLIIKNCSLGKAYRAYYFRLYNSIDEKYLNRYVRAEGFESKNSCYDGIDNNFDGKIDSFDAACKSKKNVHNLH